MTRSEYEEPLFGPYAGGGGGGGVGGCDRKKWWWWWLEKVKFVPCDFDTSIRKGEQWVYVPAIDVSKSRGIIKLFSTLRERCRRI